MQVGAEAPQTRNLLAGRNTPYPAVEGSHHGWLGDNDEVVLAPNNGKNQL